MNVYNDMDSMGYAEMVEGCRRHDGAAQRALYDATAPMAMGVCMRYAASREEAQDMLQDGYVKVFERVGQLKDSKRLMSWVYSVMVNNAIQTCRHNRFERLASDMEPLTKPLDLEPYLMQDIVAAMQQLSPRERLVFNLFTVEGYSVDEVAKRTRTTNVAVRVMLSRAREKMREALS